MNKIEQLILQILNEIGKKKVSSQYPWKSENSSQRTVPLQIRLLQSDIANGPIETYRTGGLYDTQQGHWKYKGKALDSISRT